MVQWGDAATWVSAIGTVSAVVVALKQVARERHARQDKEDKDRTDRTFAHARLISAWTGPAERVPEAHRVDYGDDADADYAYNYRTPVYVHNSSAEPIYEVVVGIVFIQGAAPRNLEGMLDMRQQRRKSLAGLAAEGKEVSKEQRAWQRDPVTTAGMVAPGTWRLWIKGRGWTSILSGRGGVDVAFVDRAEVSWVRRAMGPLDRLPMRPLKHFAQYGLYGPYDFQTPEPIN